MRYLTMTAVLGMGAAAIVAQAQPAAAQSRGVAPGAGPRLARPAPGAIPAQRVRWGGNVGGRWHGGVYAPGGWSAYRRPARGWVLPGYWIAPSFFIDDYATYNLTAPPRGYRWSRYYDDAVMVDEHGRVRDVVNGLDWDRYDDGYAYRSDGYDGGYDVADQGLWRDGGYVEHEERRAPPPVAERRYGAPYDAPGRVDRAPARRPVVYAPRHEIVAPPPGERSRTVAEVEQGYGYAHQEREDRPYTTVVRGPGTVTTITVVPAVTTTTVTTDYVYERPTRRVTTRRWTPACACDGKTLSR